MGPIGRYGPPLAVMALIFALSAQPDLNSGLGVWDTILRKLGHMTIYAVLWLALARAFDWRRPLLAAAIALAYACSDEWHQSCVEGRHGAPIDVAIDACGIALAWLAWALTARHARAATASRAR